MWGSSFAERWPQGISSLLHALKTAGLEAEPDTSLSTASLSWPEVSKLSSVSDASFTESSWGYLGANTRSLWPERAAFLIVHTSRRKDKPTDFQGLVLWSEFPEAVLDVIVRSLALADWAGDSHAVPPGVTAEAGVVIGPDCVIGEGTILEAGVRLGRGVRIGRNSRIGAHSRIGDESVIGAHAQLSGFNSIGAQGFGLVDFPSKPHKRPRWHVGRAVVGDHVRLGVYVSVDRAVFGETRLADGVCIDNHTQIGHNSSVGENSVLLGYVAISGSTHIGARTTISGLSGTNGHLTIGDDCVIAAQSGVTADLPNGSVVKGYPPRPLKEALKISSLTTRLPEIYERLRSLEKQILTPKGENS